MNARAAQVKIRPELPQDIDPISEVHRLAFGQEDEARLVRAIRGAPEFDPNLSLVAETIGPAPPLVIGHILFSPISIQTSRTPVPAIALAPVAICPEYQGKGIGSRLVEAGIQACKQRGHRVVFVLGHPSFYRRFGFVPADPYGLKCPFPAPAEAFMVLGLDFAVLRGIAGAVRYPTCFFVSATEPGGREDSVTPSAGLRPS